jgi:hypothetical protein
VDCVVPRTAGRRHPLHRLLPGRGVHPCRSPILHLLPSLLHRRGQFVHVLEENGERPDLLIAQRIPERRQQGSIRFQKPHLSASHPHSESGNPRLHAPRPSLKNLWSSRKRPVKIPAASSDAPHGLKERRGQHLHRSYDLPYCTLAPLTHESLAVPASASHFSIATL